MDSSTSPIISQKLLELLGDNLRSLVLIDENYDVLFAREDIKSKYSKADTDAIFEERKAASLSSKYLEDTWRAGEHFCTIYWFEDIFSFHFMLGDVEVSISVDSDAKFELNALKDIVHEIARDA